MILTHKFRVDLRDGNGPQYVNPTVVKTSSSGVVRTDTGAMIAGTDSAAFTPTGTGLSQLTFTEPSPGLSYVYTTIATWNGHDYSETKQAQAATDAIQPLFVSSKAVLQSQLRLTGAVQPDALALIDHAIEFVRGKFFDALGAARISTLLGYSYVVNASDNNSILRMKANLTEVSYVRWKLLQIMPSMFLDAAAKVQQAWNEEGLTRMSSKSSQQYELDQLYAEIEKHMDDLRGLAPSESIFEIDCIGPATPPPGLTAVLDQNRLL
jgi:hypothetical protein